MHLQSLVQYILAPIFVGLVIALVNHWLDDHDP
ncbi:MULTISPECIES: type I toxin-antitoxin system Fst family toxin [Enterococcus]|nr:type I toxin-antitoxin system Fst family toxin [Enterococcus sp. 665A]MBO1339862.1 type I toxin-antitoxin system Fst family toxin [Enterococcus sp. 665A]